MILRICIDDVIGILGTNVGLIRGNIIEGLYRKEHTEDLEEKCLISGLFVDSLHDWLVVFCKGIDTCEVILSSVVV